MAGGGGGCVVLAHRMMKCDVFFKGFLPRGHIISLFTARPE